MAIDVDKLDFISKLNSFKNLSVLRGELDLPASVGAGTVYVDTLEFTLQEQASFVQAYINATAYDDYFQYLDSKYHDHYMPVNNNVDFLVFSSSGLLNYDIYMKIFENKVTFSLRLSRMGFGAVTINHPTYKVPITFVEYRLAN